jgi:hypothetical protein
MNHGYFVWPATQDWLESLRWVAITFTILIALALAGSFVSYDGVIINGHPWLPVIRCKGCCFCGMTRSFCAMSSGYWREAAQWNRGGPILYIGGWFWLLGKVFYSFLYKFRNQH